MKRIDWLVAGFLAVLCLFVVGGVLVFWLQSQAYSNLPTEALNDVGQTDSAGDGLVAKQALLAADELAKQWQPDAKIVSASASIDQFETLEAAYGGKSNWTVIYYSQVASSIASYTVTDKGASFLNSKVVDTQLSTLDVEKIVLDSNQAMTIALSNGANLLFEGKADRIVSLRLVQSEESGRSEWKIFIQNETSGDFLNFYIDTETGQVRQ